MDQDVKAVEVMMTNMNQPNIEFDEGEESSDTAFSNFRMFSTTRMSFFEGPGEHAIDIVQRSLSLPEIHLEEKTAGEGRSGQMVAFASSEALKSNDEDFQEDD